MKAAILIVDDNKDNLLALEAVLDDLGQDVVRADSGRSALRKLLEQDFAVILLDVQMPEMDGFETAALIRARERSRSTPIIFITAYSKGEEYVFKGYQQGAVDYIFKPFSNEVLRTKVSVFVDLHLKSRKIAEQARELERSNADLEQFAYAASHDLKAPLRKIAGFVHLLRKELGEDAAAGAARHMEKILSGVEEMDRLISDLLIYARADLSDAPKGMIRSAKVLERTLEDLAPIIEEEHAKISVGDLPSVVADPVQLRRVFQNLVGNALKFHGDAPPEVRVSARREDDDWIFSVEDNGIGIRPEHHERIFQLFKRLHSKERYPGTGIGLAICKKIVESNHGRIWLRSSEGHGATFFFSLPARSAHDA